MEEYEWFHALQAGEATYHQVRDSELGIDGWWASAQERVRVQVAALGAYERFHGLQAGEALLQSVEESPEGLDGWAAEGVRYTEGATADLLGSSLTVLETNLSSQDVSLPSMTDT